MRKVDPSLIPYLLEETASIQKATPYFSIKELVEDVRKFSVDPSDTTKLRFCLGVLRSRVCEEEFKELTKDIPNLEWFRG